MHRVKWITYLIVVLLVLIIVFQNLAQTEVHLLFAKVTMPQAALLTVMLLVGFGLGLSARALWKVRGAWKKARNKPKS